MNKKLLKAVLIFDCIILFALCASAGFLLYLMVQQGLYEEAAVTLLLCLMFIVPTLFLMNVVFKLSKSPSTLSEKIASCPLRMQNGSSYCVDCAQSYTCGSEFNKEKKK
jgi:hypothetical protein